MKKNYLLTILTLVLVTSSASLTATTYDFCNNTGFNIYGKIYGAGRIGSIGIKEVRIGRCQHKYDRRNSLVTVLHCADHMDFQIDDGPLKGLGVGIPASGCGLITVTFELQNTNEGFKLKATRQYYDLRGNVTAGESFVSKNAIKLEKSLSDY